MKDNATTTPEYTNIRLRLSPSELDDIETVRQFLGLKSVSAAAARLAVWNAKMLAESLRSDGSKNAFATTVSEVAADAVRLSFRRAILEGLPESVQ